MPWFMVSISSRPPSRRPGISRQPFDLRSSAGWNRYRALWVVPSVSLMRNSLQASGPLPHSGRTCQE